MALDLFLVRMITLNLSGKDLHTNNGYIYRYLPRNPIGRLFGINSLVVLVIPEVLEAIQDHDDSTLAVAATGTITLTVLLRLIRPSHLGGDGIAYQVKAAGEVDT